MARTYLDLQQDALGDDFDPIKYRTLAKQWINDALVDIARQAHIPSMETTWTPTIVAGTASYTLPSDEVRLLSAFHSDLHQALSEVMPEDIDTSGTSRGRPTEFAQVAGTVVLYPTPDSAYPITFRYLKTLAALSSDTSDASAEIPDAYADLVVSFTRARLFRKEDDAEMSAFWRGEYDRDLMRLKSDVQRRSRSRTRQIPGPYRVPLLPRFNRP